MIAYIFNIFAICKHAIFSQGIVPSVPYLFVLFIILTNESPLFFISFFILIYSQSKRTMAREAGVDYDYYYDLGPPLVLMPDQPLFFTFVS